MAGEGEKQLGQGAPEEKDRAPEKEPDKAGGVPIDAGDESLEKPNREFSQKVLEEILGKDEAAKALEGPDSQLNTEIEKMIRDNPEHEKKVQQMLEKPEEYVGKEEVSEFKDWLQKRIDGAKKDEKSEEKDGENKEKKEELPSGFDLKAELEEVRNLSNQDLMARLFEKLQKFLKRFSDGSLEQLFGLGGPMFSKKEVENIKVDVDKAEKQFETPEKETNETKVVKFVCDALNLPVKKDVNALWFSLQNSEGITYEKNKDLFTNENVREGDVLFFRKEGESTPYLAAIVSKVGPPIMMKYVDESGSVKEEDVLKSDLYAKEWFGFMKLPNKDEKKDEKKSDDEEVTFEKVQ